MTYNVFSGALNPTESFNPMSLVVKFWKSVNI